MATRRVAIEIRGVVQGVGFRPFVVGLATRLGVVGEVANVGGCVEVDASAEAAVIEVFLVELVRAAPRAAHIASLETREVTLRQGLAGFSVRVSEPSAGAAFVAADRGPCADCARDLEDPEARRSGYAFGSCNACGPRWTVVRTAPYERCRTTMASFPTCAACGAELADPTSRYFLAETIACAACGPRISFDGALPPGSPADPLRACASAIRAGAIVAVKGVGGYHLACDALESGGGRVVERLRERKQRDAKPFALLVADAAAAREIVELDEAERALLESPARPIVLCRRRSDAALRVADAVAPRLPGLGVMAPPSLLHLALARACGGPLVLTSGNRSDGPMAIDPVAARAALAGVADAFLDHDREIVVRVDDSVARVVSGRRVMMRRARGFAPEPIRLARAVPEPILAVGGDLKAAFALAVEDQVMVSPHVGDLSDVDVTHDFERCLAHAESLLGVRPRIIAHDLHPDYESTRVAQSIARNRGGVAVGIPHHHAHIAACMADGAHRGPVIGFAFDGLGLGDDGALRGGEVLVGDYDGFRRAAHLRFVGMPGGDRASREPWRMALAHLIDAGLEPSGLEQHASASERAFLESAVRKSIAPRVSSVGRLFDAVACLVGVAGTTSFEGQAAMELEGLAATSTDRASYPFEISGASTPGASAEIDSRPVIRAVVRDRGADVPVATMAARFHRGLAELIARLADAIRRAGGPSTVALSGGVFVNAVLLSACEQLLRDGGFIVLRHDRLPPNDGCLALGQICLVSGRSAHRRDG